MKTESLEAARRRRAIKTETLEGNCPICRGVGVLRISPGLDVWVSCKGIDGKGCGLILNCSGEHLEDRIATARKRWATLVAQREPAETESPPGSPRAPSAENGGGNARTIQRGNERPAGRYAASFGG